jgi:hypothetical protein
MKKSMKHYSKLALVAVLTVMMFVLTGCTAVQISANLALKEDGTGTRTITASIAKNDLQDGYGSAYYYLKKHGNDLAQYVQDTYKAKVSGSENWLDVTVDNSGADWEVINLTFNFSSFEDYQTKLASLAYDKDAAATYTAPEFTVNDDGTATYTENTAALTAIFKSLQTTILADDSVFDFNSTKDGKATNDGSADLQSLTDFGVELMKPEFGTAMTISLGSADAAAVEAKDNVYSVTGKYEVKAASEDTNTTSDAADTSTDTNGTTNTDTTTTTDVPKTGESIAVAVISLVGLAGCAAVFMISRKHKTQNQ